MNKHGWVYDKDHLAALFNIPSRIGQMGPADIDKNVAQRLDAGEGTPFVVSDDEGEPLYEGRYIGDPFNLENDKPGPGGPT